MSPAHRYRLGDIPPLALVPEKERCWRCDTRAADTDIGLCTPCRDRMHDEESEDGPRR